MSKQGLTELQRAFNAASMTNAEANAFANFVGASADAKHPGRGGYLVKEPSKIARPSAAMAELMKAFRQRFPALTYDEAYIFAERTGKAADALRPGHGSMADPDEE